MKNKDNSNKNGPNLSRWFWGTIIILALATISLTILANYQTKTLGKHSVNGIENAESFKKPDKPKELTAEQLRPKFDKTKDEATTKTLQKVRPLVEKAYEPVFEAIPNYSNFHYSVLGSYTELGYAAIESPTKKLEEILNLNSLGEKLEKIAKELDQDFNINYNESLEKNFDTTGKLGTLTNSLIRDAGMQTGASAIVFTTGGIFGPKLATAMAVKISAKIASKTAFKATSKIASALGASGTSALACGWAGPAAALCAVAGGTVAWFSVDAAVGKVDSYFTKDDLEKFIREVLNQSKEEQIKLLTDTIKNKAAKKDKNVEIKIKNFTIRQLTEQQKSKMCEEGRGLISEYEKFSLELVSRKGDAKEKLLVNSQKLFDSLLLSELAREIHTNLENKDDNVLVELSRLFGNVPIEYQANRKLSGFLNINGDEFVIEKTKSSEKTGFSTSLYQQKIKINQDEILNISVRIEQHLVFKNRHFTGKMKSTIFDALSEGKGLQQVGNIKIPIREKNNQNKGSSEINLTFTISEKPLPELIYKSICSIS